MILDVTHQGKKVGVGDYNPETKEMSVRLNDKDLIKVLTDMMDCSFSVYKEHPTEFDLQLTPLEQMKENNADNE